MSELTMWSAVIGFIMPPVIALINQQTWPAQLKGLVAFAACLLASAVTVYLRGDATGVGGIVHVMLIVFFTAIGTYAAWWGPGRSRIASGIESATSTRPR